jgi:AraC family transcriptional regulator
MQPESDSESGSSPIRISELSELIKPVNSSAGWPWEGLRVELFRFDGPLCVSASGDDYYVGLVREGEGTGWLGGEGGRRHFTAGHIGIFPPGTDHGASSIGALALVSIYLKPSLMTHAAGDTDPANVEIVPQVGLEDATLRRLAMALEAELQSGLPPNRLFGESMGMALAAHLISRYAVKPAAHPYRGGMPKYLLRQAIDYMQSNLGADLRLSELAENVNMSPWHFCRAFKQSTGLPPHQYLMRERIAAAKRLLKQPHRGVAEIAVQLGFADRSHFITVFRRLTGYTPKQFVNER